MELLSATVNRQHSTIWNGIITIEPYIMLNLWVYVNGCQKVLKLGLIIYQQTINFIIAKDRLMAKELDRIFIGVPRMYEVVMLQKLFTIRLSIIYMEMANRHSLKQVTSLSYFGKEQNKLDLDTTAKLW